MSLVTSLDLDLLEVQLLVLVLPSVEQQELQWAVLLLQEQQEELVELEQD
jgi:hypothetical protein